MASYNIVLLLSLLLSSSSSLAASSTTNDVKVTCEIPNQNSNGTCMHRNDCASYIQLFNGTMTADKLGFIKTIQCKSILNESLICCPLNNESYRNVSSGMKEESSREGKAFRKGMFNKKSSTRFGTNMEHECGFPALSSKIYGGELTELSDFPWMAILIYENHSRCGGTLISHRFVLTAAHCISYGAEASKGQLKYIRLGEYNLEADPDCIKENDDTYDCAEPKIEIEPEEIIIHPKYNEANRNNAHDIALIKLKENVEFNEFVEPICLPKAGMNNGIKKGSKFYVAGWGRTDFYVTQGKMDILSPLKLKVQIPYFDKDLCQKIYKPHKLTLTKEQICAGGEKGKDACPGDSGSPLMYFDSKSGRWILTGIVSIGLKECGTDGVPGIYMNVAEYISWIEENITK